MVEACQLGVPAPVVLGILRTFAIGISQIVTAQCGFFRRNVEDALFAKGMPLQEMFAAAAPVRLALQCLRYRTTFLLRRRLVEQVAFENLISRFEEAMEENQVRRTKSAGKHTIAFVELSGFTERTEGFGDEDAARLANDLIAIVQAQCSEHRGHLVKALGDGAMTHFGVAADAVHCAMAIVSEVRGAGLPSVRAAIAAGPVIMRDRDYFGRTVNLAARLLGIAGPNQIVVTKEIVDAVYDPELIFDALSPVRLKGVAAAARAHAALQS